MVRYRFLMTCPRITLAFIVKIDDTKICARDVNAESNSLIKDACQGDSGGPLMLDRRGEDGKCEQYLLCRILKSTFLF